MSIIVPARLELVTTDKQLEQFVKKEIRAKLDKILKLAASAIRRRILPVIENAIRNNETFNSLLSGQLKAEMGLISPTSVLEPIVDTILKNIEVISKKTSFRTGILGGGIQINILKSDFADILNLPRSSYRSNRFDIKWLEWLLVEGDRVIWSDYIINFNLTPEQIQRSRSGEALMFRIQAAGGWRVPPEFSGIATDNFLIKALKSDQVKNSLLKIMQQEILQRI